MWGDPLHVDEPAGFVIGKHPVTEPHEGALGCVGRVMEHRLPREQPTDGQAIETADQLTIAPRLDRVSPSELV